MRAVITSGVRGQLVSLTSKTDYYPFGMPMPNQQITDQNYRYAFQGQEKDPETGMEAFELRLWDGRLGRWLTVDPYHEFHSPYVGMGNNPVNLTDPDGGKTSGPGNGIPAILTGNYQDPSSKYGPQNSIFAKPIQLDNVIVISHRSPKSSNFKLDMSFDRKFNGFNFSYDDSWRRVGNNFTPTIDNNSFKHNWNVDKAVETLNNNALSSSSGYCARYVRYALEAGGVNTNGRPGSAKDYDTFLFKKGFNKVSSLYYKPITGDIVVMEAFVGLKKVHPHGHIQMFNGKKWISDFVQKDFWPGSDYRNAQPINTILRK